MPQSLPQYQHNVVAKIQSVEGSAANNGMVQGALKMFNNLSEQIANVPAARPTSNSSPRRRRSRQILPCPSSSARRRRARCEVIQNVAGPLLEPLANLTIIIIFVIFILLQKEDLRDRFIMLAGGRDLQRTTHRDSTTAPNG